MSTDSKAKMPGFASPIFGPGATQPLAPLPKVAVRRNRAAKSTDIGVSPEIRTTSHETRSETQTPPKPLPIPDTKGSKAGLAADPLAKAKPGNAQESVERAETKKKASAKTPAAKKTSAKPRLKASAPKQIIPYLDGRRADKPGAGRAAPLMIDGPLEMIEDFNAFMEAFDNNTVLGAMTMLHWHFMNTPPDYAKDIIREGAMDPNTDPASKGIPVIDGAYADSYERGGERGRFTVRPTLKMDEDLRGLRAIFIDLPIWALVRMMLHHINSRPPEWYKPD